MEVTGNPKEASNEGTYALSTKELRLMHRKGTVRWELEVKAQETSTLTYSYERYVPSR